MNSSDATRSTARVPVLWDFLEYAEDVSQRSALFLDVLRERADNMLDREAAGMPPLLHFDWEVVCDARQFERPVNYALLRITGCPHGLERFVQAGGRPVIVFDPRAGHGPGIGGFKRDSEVGVAMQLGHPVYFVSFFPDPCPGQTLGDVLLAFERFVNEVRGRHPDHSPVLYGNCQAGWAVALLCAKCSAHIRGPAVLSGSPLSYWATDGDTSSSRFVGFLLGGSWLARLIADLGHGTFDGAWFALNFEALNPRHALWDRMVAVFRSPEQERERFLEFERWWSGFYSFSREEICAIVESLFIGNQLESGELRIDQHCMVDLRLVRNPLVIFVSSGDAITRPTQALNWIREVYPDTLALKSAGQRIVYLVNPNVGHLALFISATVALREHRAILGNVDAIEQLAPGLYEMVLQGEDSDAALQVRFESRRVEDLPYEYDAGPFEAAAGFSANTALAYESMLAPWVRLLGTPWYAALAHWFHPMRVSRWIFSERINPCMAFTSQAAEAIRDRRRPIDEGNPFLAVERIAEEQVAQALEAVTAACASWQSGLFDLAFGVERAEPAKRGSVLPVGDCPAGCACPPGSCKCRPIKRLLPVGGAG